MLSQGKPRDAAVKFDTYQIYNKSIMERLCVHGNLVDADAPGAKANTKHLESRLEVIQGLRSRILGPLKS